MTNLKDESFSKSNAIKFYETFPLKEIFDKF